MIELLLLFLWLQIMVNQINRSFVDVSKFMSDQHFSQSYKMAVSYIRVAKRFSMRNILGFLLFDFTAGCGNVHDCKSKNTL